MLTSSNDYLRPEYLTPLSTTLDAKKSPLALLAQTCSQIGADTPNCKLLLAKEKSSKSSKDSSSSSSSSSSKEKSAQDLSKSQDGVSREKSLSPESKKKCDPISRSPSHQSASSSRTTPAEVEGKSLASNGSSDNRIQSPEKETSGSPQVTVSEPKTVFTPNIITSSSDSVSDMPLGTFKPGETAFLPTYAAPGFPMSMEMTPHSLASPHHMKPGLNPYFSYARLKTQDSMGQVCRDPYCTGCGVSSHLLVNNKPGACAIGCSQCDHAKPSGYLGPNAAAAAYAHALHLPYICSWISGDAQYCGKRFANSEELLYHLRTHTSVSGAETESNPATWPMLAASGLSPAHGLLHRPYPTSSLAGTRYHPYYKPSLLSSTFGTAFTAYPFTQPPYLSPYSLYTTPPRLGTTPGMLNS